MLTREPHEVAGLRLLQHRLVQRRTLRPSRRERSDGIVTASIMRSSMP